MESLPSEQEKLSLNEIEVDIVKRKPRDITKRINKKIKSIWKQPTQEIENRKIAVEAIHYACLLVTVILAYIDVYR